MAKLGRDLVGAAARERSNERGEHGGAPNPHQQSHLNFFFLAWYFLFLRLYTKVPFFDWGKPEYQK
jgi:hypothetical protein